MPIAITFFRGQGDEPTLIKVGTAYEAATHHRRRRRLWTGAATAEESPIEALGIGLGNSSGATTCRRQFLDAACPSLHTEMCADDVVGQLVDRPAGRRAAFLENAEFAGDPPRERQLLLDQQHRDARVAIEPQDDVADLVHDVRLNAFGRLVQNQQRRLEHERAADRELLLLSAREIAAAPAQHLLQHRKQVEDLRRNRTPAAGARREADAQVLLDRQLRKDLASLGHVADAEPRAAGRRDLPEIGPPNDISADEAGSSPMMHLSSVVFPMPLRPMRQVRDPAGTARSTSHSVWLPP